MNPFTFKNEDEEFKSLSINDAVSPTQCCCCICNMTNDATKDLSCCCAVQIKLGITIIGLLTILIAAIRITAQFLLMLNDQVAWWYCLVNLLLLIPQYNAAAFFVKWFAKDDIINRGNLGCSCILVVVSATLMAAWVTIYFTRIHEGDTVHYGSVSAEENPILYAKKNYILQELAWAVIIITSYSYFVCVSGRYANALKIERSKTEKNEMRKEKESKRRAEEDLDKATRDPNYKMMRYWLPDKNKADRE